MYSENSLANIRVVQSCEPLVLQAIQTVPAKCGHVFTIAEYGCADGGVSLPLLYACVEVLKSKHGAELQIHVAYEDQPMNDFKSLFFRLQGKPLHAIMTPHLSCFLLFLSFGWIYSWQQISFDAEAPFFIVTFTLRIFFLSIFLLINGTLHDDVIWLQVPECFEASYCIQYQFLLWRIARAWHKST